MRNAAALPITDIRPDTNIESEIFPKELTTDAQNKEVFTPPNHQQMRFADGQEAFPQYNSNNAGGQEDAFFITEDVRGGQNNKQSRADINDGDQEAIEEEKSYATEAEDSQYLQQHAANFSNKKGQEQDEDDGTFDFGAAKMEFFKKRARQILIENAIPEDFQYEYGEENSNGLGQLPKDNDELAYEGGPLPMKICY